MTMKNHVYFFDTTLRDGEQVPGCQLNTEEKVQIAKVLEELNVDIIEPGFPISSPGDFRSVVEITKSISKPVIAPLARAVKADIDAAAESLQFAKRKRIHTFISSSDIHIKHQFNSTREKIMEQGVESVAYAKKFVEDVQFSAMDAGRTENEFLAKFIEAAIKAGATTVNIPDTAGYCLPEEFAEKITYLMNHVKGIENVIVSVHCHNDLGLATANTVAGVQAGARQVEVTINGIGERAGNTALEEVAMVFKTRKAMFKPSSRINTKKIIEASRMVSRLMNMPVQANKSIVGKNAFAHSAGIHQHGILKHRQNYEIISPEDIGLEIGELDLTARSGKSALKYRLEKIGYSVSTEELREIYDRFLTIADEKKEITDKDLHIIMQGDSVSRDDVKLDLLEIVCGYPLQPMATIRLKVKDKEYTAHGIGNGPVDAAFKAVDEIVKKHIILDEFLVQAITNGSDDTGKVRIKLLYNGKTFFGFGADTDIVVAAVKAYIDGLNKIV